MLFVAIGMKALSHVHAAKSEVFCTLHELKFRQLVYLNFSQFCCNLRGEDFKCRKILRHVKRYSVKTEFSDV